MNSYVICSVFWLKTEVHYWN